jgi:hypothetical protein
MLSKTCRCGKKIPYNKKYCDECQKEISAQKAERNKYYDNNIRQNKEIYHSKVWKRLTNRCKNRFNGIDIYSYYVLGKLEYGNISHHIIPVNDDSSNRQYDITNLIYLSQVNHAHIHSEYNKGIESKQAMQALLFRLIDIWEKDNDI